MCAAVLAWFLSTLDNLHYEWLKGTWSPVWCRLLFCSRPAGRWSWRLSCEDVWLLWNLKNTYSVYNFKRTCKDNDNEYRDPGQTCKGAVGSDVMNNEAGSKHEQNHEQFGPGEATASHLYLQVLQTEESRQNSIMLLEDGQILLLLQPSASPDTGCYNPEGPEIQTCLPSPRWSLWKTGLSLLGSSAAKHENKRSFWTPSPLHQKIQQGEVVFQPQTSWQEPHLWW